MSEVMDAARQIDALTAASEFLMCAVRSLAYGGTIVDSDVANPILWAQEKIREATTVGLDETSLCMNMPPIGSKERPKHHDTETGCAV